MELSAFASVERVSGVPVSFGVLVLPSGDGGTCDRKLCGDFGVEELARFIEIAVVKMPHASDYTMCRYIGGIARKVREEVEEAGEREPNREMTTDDR